MILFEKLCDKVVAIVNNSDNSATKADLKNTTWIDPSKLASKLVQQKQI